MVKVKFEDLVGQVDENGDIVGDEGVCTAVFSFEDVTMYTPTMYDVPFRDWLATAQSWAQIWMNAYERGERHIYEADMAQIGVRFEKASDKIKSQATTLMEVHNG